MTTEEIKKIFEEKCRKGLHPFEKILSAKNCWCGIEIEVARWCPICGTVAVDIDVDSHTFAGRVMPARRPLIFTQEEKKS